MTVGSLLEEETGVSRHLVINEGSKSKNGVGRRILRRMVMNQTSSAESPAKRNISTGVIEEASSRICTTYGYVRGWRDSDLALCMLFTPDI